MLNVYLIVKKMLQFLHKINPAHVVKGLKIGEMTK